MNRRLSLTQQLERTARSRLHGFAQRRGPDDGKNRTQRPMRMTVSVVMLVILISVVSVVVIFM